MATLVLVHGGWAGGWPWRRVAGPLGAAGYDVFTPTLTGIGERFHLATPDVNLNTHVEDVVNVIRFEDLTNVILKPIDRAAAKARCDPAWQYRELSTTHHDWRAAPEAIVQMLLEVVNIDSVL